MKFSNFLFPDCRDPERDGSVIDETLHEAWLSDQLGVDVIWLAEHHFDGIYLGQRKLGFIGEEFRSLMLEIWKTKYLQIPRFREVIAAIPIEIRLEHFLNDGDSPDIPIPIYVGYLNQIREMARK